jgi:hypothetical protein
MTAFTSELMRRSPLAGCVLELSDYLFDESFLRDVYDPNRGRCYQDVLGFDDVLRMMRDALVRHGGSAHALFVELEADGAHPADESSFYRKLAKMPVAVSRALLHQGAAKLRALMPEPSTRESASGLPGSADTLPGSADTLPGSADTLPGCFDAFEVVIADGKKIKDAARRLAPTRGFTGALIGARALVAIDARTGLALAMSQSLDGMGNDSPLVPGLMEQLVQIAGPRPILSVWDRGFGEPKTMRAMTSRPGDRFIVRVKKNHSFTAVSCVQSIDDKGRTIIDEIGFSGGGTPRARGRATPWRGAALSTRRITLKRTGAGEEDVTLVTDLTDPALYPAADILALYAKRWGIEQVFQQVTQTFSLQHLIGASPKAVLLQFAFCLLLYDMMQVIRAWVARDGKALATMVSMHYLFDHTRRQLQAWAYHADDAWARVGGRTPEAMRQRLAVLLKGVWNAKRFTKAADKKRRVKSKPKGRFRGGHSSVQRVLEGKAKVIPL